MERAGGGQGGAGGDIGRGMLGEAAVQLMPPSASAAARDASYASGNGGSGRRARGDDERDVCRVDGIAASNAICCCKSRVGSTLAASHAGGTSGSWRKAGRLDIRGYCLERRQHSCN